MGSIIDVLVGIINISGGFYRNFDKNQPKLLYRYQNN